MWVLIKDKDFPNAYRIDVTREIDRTERITASDAKQHLTLWLALTDESLHFLLLMYRFAAERVDEVPKATAKSTVAFRSLLARICTLTVAIRRLVVAGLEDAARSVMRSWLETQDLLIAVLGDEEFAEQYSSAVHTTDYDANEFWKAEIGYGRLNKRITRALSRAEMSSKQKEDFLENRKVIKEKLSESVHSSLPSATFSEAVPSLSKPSFYNRSLLGHVSIMLLTSCR